MRDPAKNWTAGTSCVSMIKSFGLALVCATTFASLLEAQCTTQVLSGGGDGICHSRSCAAIELASNRQLARTFIATPPTARRRSANDRSEG